MSIHFTALATDEARHLQNGGSDANGAAPERAVSPGGAPCRHCLALIGAGEPMLILAYRPFPAPQPYAEIGPIFLHAAHCPRGGGSEALPAFLASPRYIVRGYDARDRIVYGTGRIVETESIPASASELLASPGVSYLHVRSATNNCFHCRIDRGVAA